MASAHDSNRVQSRVCPALSWCPRTISLHALPLLVSATVDSTSPQHDANPNACERSPSHADADRSHAPCTLQRVPPSTAPAGCLTMWAFGVEAALLHNSDLRIARTLCSDSAFRDGRRSKGRTTLSSGRRDPESARQRITPRASVPHQSSVRLTPAPSRRSPESVVDRPSSLHTHVRIAPPVTPPPRSVWWEDHDCLFGHRAAIASRLTARRAISSAPLASGA